MLQRPTVFQANYNETVDSGAETAESDFSKMSATGSESIARRARVRQQLMLLNVHLLANPGESLLLQHTLDRLLRWICPSLHVFHVSERAAPYHCYPHSSLCPAAGYPSLSVTLFLHEAYGEERILRVVDFLQQPPWQYHHAESGGGRTAGVHISSGALLRPYLLPSRDFYSLGPGMPVWGVRPVHVGGEILRVTLYSCYDNYEDAVRLYETVLQRQAQEQKPGFCWFTLHTEPGLSLQLAVKQLSPGVRVETCTCAVLQFQVEEMGQLVPLLPNPCSPISTSRWQTEDLDGNKILFQVKDLEQPQRPLTCAFPLNLASVSGHALNHSLATPLPHPPYTHGPRPLSGLEQLCGVRRGGRGGESLCSDSCCSSPPGSSCYSSQRSSPALLSSSTHHDSPLRPSPSLSSSAHHDSPLRPSLSSPTHHDSPLRPSLSSPAHHDSPLRPSLSSPTHHDSPLRPSLSSPAHHVSPLRPSLSCSLSRLLQEEEEEPETNVDTGFAVTPRSDTRSSSSLELSVTPRSERPAAVGASTLESLARELGECLPGSSRTWSHVELKAGSTARLACGSRTIAAGQSPSREPLVEANRTTTTVLTAGKLLTTQTHTDEPLDEFFI